jgi:hypothetical protein
MFTKDEICTRLAQKRAQGELLDAGYNLACFIASASLIAQKDKTNEDYAHHFLRVSRDNTDSVAKMIIGILHDVVEDTDWALDDLRTIGFSERIVLGIEGVSHKDGELYFDSIERCGLNPDSIDVKLKDNHDNMAQSRNTFLPQAKDLRRLQKYTVTRQYLIDIKKGNIAPGTPVYEWMAGKPAELQDFTLVQEFSSKYNSYTQSFNNKPLDPKI